MQQYIASSMVSKVKQSLNLPTVASDFICRVTNSTVALGATSFQPEMSCSFLFQAIFMKIFVRYSF
jgi:hypothetical protein